MSKGVFYGEKPMRLRFDVTGQTAIVTGASSGLGVSFDETLAENGANLVIVARRHESLAKLAEELSRR